MTYRDVLCVSEDQMLWEKLSKLDQKPKFHHRLGRDPPKNGPLLRQSRGIRPRRHLMFLPIPMETSCYP